MPPPNVTPPPAQQPATQGIQQAPLALTTQPQQKSQEQTTTISQLPPSPPNKAPQIQQQQQQPVQQQQQPTLTTNINNAGIEQTSITTTAIPPTATTIALSSSNSTTISSSAITPVTTTPIQLQAPITTHLSNVTLVPVAAHQQSSTINQSAMVTRPPSTLPVVPITITNVSNTKAEPNKYICCLLDNGIRCDRVAGNASFNARIQKIVGTKKMDFLLDPTVRHAYICEHHKAIITVAKKSANLTRDTKANARNHTANNNPITLAPQLNSSFNDIRQQQLQHPVNLELMANQNRLANNHAGTLNNISVRQGTQLGYTHYQGPHTNQVGSMDVMMSGNFDGTGGDHVPSGSGGIEVDLQQLQSKTLHRYKRHFGIQGSGLNKMQLAESLKNHFRTLPVIEKEAITYFVYTVKCRRNRLDHNPKADLS